ncbi:MAG: DNA repair protein RecN [Weeksellaceae bacterium]|nr:DNA repair protein RecN [Weeksellaceae bacterium]
MLLQLSVKNYALIEALQLEFSPGFTVITGETGAGKSILLGALKLALGERADLSSIKDATRKCIVEAHFSIANLDLENWFEAHDVDFDNTTILRRELLPNGKSRAFVNDTPVTLKFLQSLSSKLIDIHSQFDTDQLIEEDFQIQSLDIVAGQTALVQEYNLLYSQLQENQKNLNQLRAQQAEQLKQQDYKNFLLEELQQQQLENLDETSLQQEIQLLTNVDSSLLQLQQIIQQLDHPEIGIITQLHQANNQGKSLKNQIPGLESAIERLESLYFESKDLLSEFEEWEQKLEPDPEKLAELQNIWNQLQQLQAKHQVHTIAELISIQDQLSLELENQMQLDEQIAQLEKQISNITSQAEKIALELHKARLQAVKHLEKEWQQSLQQMSMEKAKFTFQITKRSALSQHGFTELQLLFSANEGLAPKSLEKSISGGERSRVMLAIKKSVAEKMQLPTLIFDEIDAGVSGKVAAQMGLIQQQISANTQVISISHLPQIAGMATAHLHVTKSEKDGKTSSEIRVLSPEDRIVEIAKMLSAGQVTEAATQQAKSLLQRV